MKYLVKTDCTFIQKAGGKPLYFEKDEIVDFPEDVKVSKHFELIGKETVIKSKEKVKEQPMTLAEAGKMI